MSGNSSHISEMRESSTRRPCHSRDVSVTDETSRSQTRRLGHSLNIDFCSPRVWPYVFLSADMKGFRGVWRRGGYSVRCLSRRALEASGGGRLQCLVPVKKGFRDFWRRSGYNLRSLSRRALEASEGGTATVSDACQERRLLCRGGRSDAYEWWCWWPSLAQGWAWSRCDGDNQFNTRMTPVRVWGW